MRQEKQYLLDDLKARIENSKAFIVTHYKSMSANAMNNFRGMLSKEGSEFEVIAKRVFIKAAENQGIELKKEDMQGHIGIVFTKDDFVTAAKLLCKFEEESEKIEILSGFIEGQLYDKQSVIKLSKLPSMNELRAQFIGLLEAPMSQTLGVFDALLTSVIHCLENKAKL